MGKRERQINTTASHTPRGGRTILGLRTLRKPLRVRLNSIATLTREHVRTKTRDVCRPALLTALSLVPSKLQTNSLKMNNKSRTRAAGDKAEE